jgi:hypothetical protein
MIRRAVFVCALAVTPGMPRAQEANDFKLVHCRSLEAAGYFVGPDEVLDGDRVCKKGKPGTVETEKKEVAKPAPEAVVPRNEPMGVADAARANAAAKAKRAAEKAAQDTQPTAKESAVTQVVAKPAKAEAQAAVSAGPGAVTVAPEAKQVGEPAPSVPATPPPPPAPALIPPSGSVAAPQPVESVPGPTPAAPPSVAPPDRAQNSPEPAAEDRPAAPFTSAEPVSAPPVREFAPKTTATSATKAPTPAIPIRRDAPVAPGTPTEPPEKDYGFSDANTVEVPASVNGAAGNAGRATQNSGQSVRVGGFDKPYSANASGGDEAEARRERRADCAMNLTLGSLRDEKLALVTPKWAEEWIAKNQKRMATICFSGAPMKGVKNYLIVFYVAPVNGTGLPLPDARAAGGFKAEDGSTWHYGAERIADSADAGHQGGSESSGDAGQVWYATAYTEEGVPVAERWPESSKRDEARASEDLLNAVIEDLRKL